MTRPALPVRTLTALLLLLGPWPAACERQVLQASPQDPVPAPPRSALHLLVSGSMLGRLEPCGCASGQLGGLARRRQHIAEQRDYDLLIEGGDLVAGTTELDGQKLYAAASVLFDMDPAYDVLAVGPRDLPLYRSEWSNVLAAAPVVATNLECEAPDWPGKPFQEKTVRGQTVRTAALLLDELPKDLRQDDTPIRSTAPATAWSRAFADADPATLRIAVLHGGETAIRTLVPQLRPRPDLAIAVDAEYVEPSPVPTPLDGVPLVFAGIRGRVLLAVRLWREDERPRATCELVPLAGSRTVPGGGGDPATRDLILQHRRDVKDGDVLTLMARRNPTPNGAAYVGTATCAACHPTAMKAFEASKHGHAWQTLVDAEQDPQRYGWPVTAYPDCVACHTVGYGEQTGFVSFEETPQLANVGCERCHGPGSAHVQAPTTNRLGIIGGQLPSLLCTQCHDYEQSPTFVYGDRWPSIRHGREPK